MTKNAGFDILMMPGGNPDRNENKKGGQTEKRMNRTRSEAREAGSSADGARRDNTGQRIHCKKGRTN